MRAHARACVCVCCHGLFQTMVYPDGDESNFELIESVVCLFLIYSIHMSYDFPVISIISMQYTLFTQLPKQFVLCTLNLVCLVMAIGGASSWTTNSHCLGRHHCLLQMQQLQEFHLCFQYFDEYFSILRCSVNSKTENIKTVIADLSLIEFNKLNARMNKKKSTESSLVLLCTISNTHFQLQKGSISQRTASAQ